MGSPQWAVGFPLLFLAILAISLVPAVFGMPEGPNCTNYPNSELSDNKCFTDCSNRVDGQCDPRKYAGQTCQCKPGFFLDQPRFLPEMRWNKEAKCIKWEQCPVQCDIIFNAELLHCGDRNYSHCHTTCANPEPVCDGIHKDCGYRCQCKAGYTWDKSYRRGGRCIKPEQCNGPDVPRRSADCEDPNIVYKKMNTCHQHKCNPSCKHPNGLEGEECRKEKQCDKLLEVPYCVCRDGYVSWTEDGMGKCVKLEECPKGDEEEGEKTCGLNEEFNSRCSELSCNLKDGFFGTSNERRDGNGTVVDCPKRCQCQQDFVRRMEDGLCVSGNSNDCYQPSCGTNEELQIPYCIFEPSCGQLEIGKHSALVCGTLERACYCQWGFVRRDDGLCVREEECPEDELCPSPDEERLLLCPGYKEPSCDRPKAQLSDCDRLQRRCVCKQGFVRKSTSRDEGPCVRASSCPLQKEGKNNKNG